MLEPSGLYYPNRIARWFFLAMEDVMGKHGLNAVLGLAGLEAFMGNPPPDALARQFDFAYMAALNQALEDMYGPRGGRGMALRIGRATVSQGMKNFGALAGMADPAFQALPLVKRQRIGLDALAAVFSRFSDQVTSVSETDSAYQLSVEISPMAWGRNADRPVCHALVGITQEVLSYASGGYEFHVQEIACRAAGGDQCVFKINKTPIGQSQVRST
ncbi:MAG: 4-vinyl reductase [bacterium]|nr:4-vinyl reductase [bacterium]